MTAAMYRLPTGSLTHTAPGDTLTLTGDEKHHAVTVKRTTAGETILLADGSGLVAHAEVTTITDTELSARVTTINNDSYPGPRFILIQALAKGDRDLQAIEAATELGVDEIIPWQSRRAIVQWKGPRAEKALRKWQSQVEAAAKQSRRPHAPTVQPHISSTSNHLGNIVRHADLALVLHEEATTPITTINLPTSGNIALFVGPEGGISPEEIDILTDAGATPVHMGRYVLRASSAGPAAIAALSCQQRWNTPPTM
ncbi:16S rRNA (uracil(1498)-N(3))-methyltransferase [Dermatophilus congolensis]|uniref:16S rRNA (uracil(1498)-N(3))-methyltransferase n=1 Tax=Dermatophilus congolensis TaxID=1863 RepID=UPI001AAFD8AD|nr:16S rRNA (uracil(1498)-N(3))-methyltransferase [Dermatophilus congolensis]MBO3142676.1 16S rRNA (uracil(1498)-N(3))-methyltransferase [Dermatophilus congolensis]MBO3151668.1 16S rRNA (uracil(1498)-N(3))-methyltransferase [Dermatophilus congolensis]MBO3161332.1 16S rRNA (uracil(1498)-N(3))-methyltransferase [Dermatophilus congolensis]MBO3162949.1 16S rRNA (uracil(1498)-N(3))-methyltransferase [Dermatophilus congolensis]MBO3176501.1 16S rRNA (uracil(1498)-N(3))-methyltransferase [Dermatophilu